MKEQPYSRIIEERLIAKFKKEFYQKTGKLLRVENYRPENLPYPIISLNDLEYVCNLHLPERFTSIKDDTRCFDVLYPRMIFMAIAYSMEYPIRRIASFMERDRTSVYNAVSNFDNLMQTGDPLCMDMYDCIVNQINSRYESTISTLSDASDYAKPAVSAVLL